MKAIAVLLSLALAPIAINGHLRNVYRQTLAHWLSKVVPPPTVFIGDSITAGGQWFDDIRNINLGSNGLATHQIAGSLTVAKTYHPKRIVIMAGINDAVRSFDHDKIRELWETICKEPAITVTLVTPTKDDELNRRIDQINSIIMDKCRGKPLLKLDLADERGRLRPEFNSTGVSLSPKAYEQWNAKLRFF